MSLGSLTFYWFLTQLIAFKLVFNQLKPVITKQIFCHGKDINQRAFTAQ
jgi:hypothetical protein